MFSILRTVLIIGAIFYYSPVRQTNDVALPFESYFKANAQIPELKPLPQTTTTEPSARLETMWQALPDNAKQAVIDKILSTSGLAASEPKPAPAMDTLNASDRLPGWKGETRKP